MANPALQTRTVAGATAYFYEVDGRKVDVADEDVARIEGINNDVLKLVFLQGYKHPENADPQADTSATDRRDAGGPDKEAQQGNP